MKNLFTTLRKTCAWAVRFEDSPTARIHTMIDGRTKMSRLFVVSLLATTLIAEAAFGFVCARSGTGQCLHWAEHAATLQSFLGTPGHVLSNGTSSWDQNAMSAASDWNGVRAGFQFNVGVGGQFHDPCGSQGMNNICAIPRGSNPVYFADSKCGVAFGDAIELVLACWDDQSGALQNAAVLLNNKVSWNAYDGPLQFPGGHIVYDIRRVLLHEFGHVLGLDHPDKNGQHVAAIMNSTVSDVDRLQPDDISGIMALYAPPTPSLPRIHIDIGSARGGPGDTVAFSVSLSSSGVSVAATSNDITFDKDTLTLDPATCAINSAIAKSLTAGIVEPGTVRVIVQARQDTTPIPNGPLYTCTVRIAPLALPGTSVLANSNTLAFSPAGAQLLDTAGSDGVITISLVPRACIGDCDGNGEVTVDELIAMVNIALGSLPLSVCEAGDLDDSGDIAVNEVITAVSAALNGCK